MADGGGLLEEGRYAEEVAFFFPGGHYLDADGEAGLGEAAGDGDGGAAGEGEGESEYQPAYVGGEGVALHLGEVADVHVEGGRDDGGTYQHVVVAEEFGAAVDYRAASEFGAGYVLRTEGEAVFDVPDDFFLEFGAMFPEKGVVGGDELGAAQGLEYPLGVGEVGGCFLDLSADVGEFVNCGAAYLRDLGVHGGYAEVRGVGDPGRRSRIVHPVDEGTTRRRQAQRVGRVRAGLGVEHQGYVADVPAHRPFDGQGGERDGAGAVGDAARGGAQSDDGAEAGWDSEAAAEVAAGGEPYLAGGERGRGAAGRASAGLARVPGVARLAENLVEGVGARAELGRVGLGEYDAALVFEVSYEEVGLVGYVVSEYGRAASAADAGYVLQVLYRYWKAVKVAARGVRLVEVGQANGVFPGPVSADGGERVYGVAGLVYAVQGGVN